MIHASGDLRTPSLSSPVSLQRRCSKVATLMARAEVLRPVVGVIEVPVRARPNPAPTTRAANLASLNANSPQSTPLHMIAGVTTSNRRRPLFGRKAHGLPSPARRRRRRSFNSSRRSGGALYASTTAIPNRARPWGVKPKSPHNFNPSDRRRCKWASSGFE